jgi:multidrug efflux pump subunit AcrA (membrane-fusion protein)
MTQGRVRILVTALRVIGLVLAALMVCRILLAVLPLGPAIPLASSIASTARALNLGLTDLFTPVDRRLGIALNYGIAAVLWLVIGILGAALVARLCQQVGGRDTPENTTGKDARSSRPATADAPGAKSGMSRPIRIALITIIVVTVAEALAFGGTYFFYSRHYVSTDNAQVDGDKIDINAPATGTLDSWQVNEGSSVRANQVVGRVRIMGSGAQPQMVIKSPGSGTVAVNNAVDGSFVTAGTELATAYDFSRIYAVARVQDTDVEDVHPGAPVDIAVDAFPDTPVTGVVEVVQGSSAGVFSLYPNLSSGDPSNPQKVNQYIPVKIEFTNTNGLTLAPGMNITAHIRVR